jgi:hypothetical protein
MIRFSAFALLLLALVFVGCGTATTSTPKPTIVSFTASPASLPAGGGSVTLSWNVKDATSLSVDNGVGAVTGTSTTVSVTSTTTFTLTATNNAGSATQSESVSVGAGADTTPPTVVSIDPPDGATGVRDDQSIVLTFSEKMDQLSAQAAYQSGDLPASEVTFNWNTEGTQLTVKANDFLEYAAGEDPSIEAKTYALSVTSTAKDVAGNSLTPFSSSFSTLKVIVTSIYATAGLDGDCYGSTGCDLARATFAVGDLATAPTDSGFRGFVSFDLRTLPTGVVADEARLIIYKAFINFNSGGPDPYPLGDMLLENVNYGNSLTGEDYNTPVIVGLGIFDSGSEPATGYLGSDVTSALNDDLDNRTARGNRSQYRFRFPIENNDNNASDYVSFTSSDGPEGQRPFLNVVYYLP